MDPSRLVVSARGRVKPGEDRDHEDAAVPGGVSYGRYGVTELESQ